MSNQKIPDHWKKSDSSLRAIQLAFEFSLQISDVIRHQANKNGLSTSDQLRKIIQLQVKPPKRPRLTVSLNPEDYQTLADRYQLAADDKTAIRKAVREEIVAFAKLNSES